MAKLRRGWARGVEKIDRSELEELSTVQLLGRLQRLRECEESFEHSDIQGGEEVKAIQGRVAFKTTQDWIDAYQDVKAILGTREHIPK